MTVDTTPPTKSVITSPSSGTVTNDTTPTLTGTGEVGASVVVKDESNNTLCTSTVDASGNWTCTPASAITEGGHSFTTETTDSVGNGPTTGDPVAVTIDTTNPSGSGSSLSSPTTPTNNTGATISGSCGPDAGNGKVRVTTTPANGFTNQYDIDVTLDANGDFTITNPNWQE